VAGLATVAIFQYFKNWPRNVHLSDQHLKLSRAFSDRQRASPSFPFIGRASSTALLGQFTNSNSFPLLNVSTSIAMFFCPRDTTSCVFYCTTLLYRPSSYSLDISTKWVYENRWNSMGMSAKHLCQQWILLYFMRQLGVIYMAAFNVPFTPECWIDPLMSKSDFVRSTFTPS